MLSTESLLEATHQHQRQLKLEEEAHERAKARLIERTQAAYDRAYGSNTPEARTVIRELVEPVAEAMKASFDRAMRGKPGALVAECSSIRALDPRVCALVALRRSIDVVLCPKRGHYYCSLSHACSTVGRALIDEALALVYEAQDPDGYARLTSSPAWKTKAPRKRHATISVHFSKKDSLTRPDDLKSAFFIGSWALNAIMSSVGLFTQDKRHTSRKAKNGSYVLVPTDDLQQHLTRLRDLSQDMAWMHLPMVCPPNPWGGDGPGGYLTADRRKALRQLVSGQPLPSAAGGKALEALNTAQLVPYRVNELVLEVANELMTQRRTVGKFRCSEPVEIPSCPPDPSPEELKEWKRMKTDLCRENAILSRKNYATGEALWTANKFRDETFWFPWMFDFRGRMYPRVSFMSPQGTDFDKALLLFAEAGPVNEYWLSFQVATTYGLDKATMDERQQWTKAHQELIHRVADDPIAHLEDWEFAEEPWQFLAACVEYTDCIRDGRKVSSLPIGVDATCSGIQHLSALTLDASAASLTNVLPTDKPADAYRAVAEEVVRLMPESAPYMNRSVVKRVVMTLPYGLTMHSARDYLREALKGVELQRGELSKLTKVVFQEAIPAVLPGPVKAMQVLKDMAKEVCTRDGFKTITWTTPTGFPVTQRAMESASIVVETKIHGSERLQVRLHRETDKPHKRRHVQSIAPNFIHSLDAALLQLTFAQEDRPFMLIHDCVLMRSCDLDYASRRLRETFVELYRQPLLQRFADDLGVSLPDGVIQGTLDIEEALRSPYLFC